MPGNTTSTKLLLDFEGSSIADRSLGGTSKTFTPIAGADPYGVPTAVSLSTTQKKFGQKSLRMVGEGEHVSVSISDDFAFGTGPFTIDFQVRIDDVDNGSPAGWWLDDDNYLVFDVVEVNGTTIRLGVTFKRLGTIQFQLTGTSLLSGWEGAWKHVSLTRSGTNLELHLDGTRAAQGAVAASLEINLDQMLLLIGKGMFRGIGQQAFGGYIDEFRVSSALEITQGASITPPVREYIQRCRNTGLGSFPIHKSWRNTGLGKFDVAISRYRNTGLGEFSLAFKWRNTGLGSFVIQETWRNTGLGSFGINLARYRNAGVGTFVIQRSFRNTGLGQFPIFDTRWRNTGLGQYDLLQAWRNTGLGKFDLMFRWRNSARGFFAIDDGTLVGYELHTSLTGFPDIDGTPLETWTSLPHTTTVTLSGEGLHYFTVIVVNSSGLYTVLEKFIVELDGSNNEITQRPKNPRVARIAAGPAGVVKLSAEYLYTTDANVADKWALYITSNGVDPDPDVDSPTLVDVKQGSGVAALNYTTSAFGDATDVRVIIRMQRSSDSRDSDSTTVLQIDASTQGPGAPASRVVQRQGGRLVIVKEA